MKKIISLILTLLMLAPAIASPSFAESEEQPIPVSSFDITPFVNLSVAGVTPGANAAHGNHQIRTVHTSHGDFAAYITGSYTDDKGVVDQWTLFKIDAESGKAEAVFTGEKYQDTSQVSLLVDKDENVWAITASSDYYRHMNTEGVDVRANRYDAKTGEVTTYTSLIAGGTQDIYGYSTSYYDEKNDCIIALFSGGTHSDTGNGASFDWVIFDMKTNRWKRNVYYTKVPSRHCYMNGYIDENGGLMFVAVRDVFCTAVGCPEIGNNNGLSEEDFDYLRENNLGRWGADFCWDQLDLFYIPDLTKKDIITYSVIEADYSGIKGTLEERETLEYRLSNYYPQNLNSNGGDFLIEKTKEGKTLLHITYNGTYVQSAMNSAMSRDDIWYHQVWDITDPKAAEKLYNAPIVTELGVADCNETKSKYAFRLYKDEDGQIYLISTYSHGIYAAYQGEIADSPNAKLCIYKVMAEDGGYTYKKLPGNAELPTMYQVINVSSERSGSLTDGKLNVLYFDGVSYHFAGITLLREEPTLGDINGDGEINGKDSNILKQFISGTATPGETEAIAADINRDGNINGADSNILLQYLSGALDSLQ